jgi:multiple sugar transport system ATP-binding protein
MTDIETRGLSILYGGTTVLRDLDLQVRSGEFLVLLGPSGCGKSTLLNAIAGLIDINAGQVWIGGRNVTWLEPKERGIAMVFQSYALYPMMDVYGNLAFALKVAGLKSAEIDRRVRRAAETLELTSLLRRRPSALSGGQRQRVAIGRALVREVDVFLFDEPLSNLDAQLRAELRVEIKQLHRRLGNTTIYVTHDQIEALTLADRIAVMKGGVIQQLDEPNTVFNRPVNRFVASFVGSPAMNFIPGELASDGGVPAVRTAGTLIRLPRYGAVSGLAEGRAVLLGIRPEHIAVGEAAAAQDFCWPAQVLLRESLGSEVLLWSLFAETRIGVRASAEISIREGDKLPAGFSSTRVSLFDRETGERI